MSATEFRTVKKLISITFAAIFLGCSADAAWSFDLSPKGTRFDRAAVKEWSGFLDKVLTGLTDRGLPKFKQSVHEEITHRIFGCPFEGEGICSDPDAQFATPYLIAGVRWNDDPPFQLKQDQAKGLPCKISYADGRPMTVRFITQPKCWGEVFLSGERDVKKPVPVSFNQANKSALPLRSHLGDLQFLHSMASADGEDPTETRRKILGWAEFTWRTAAGDFKLETWLKDVDVQVIKEFFGDTGWRVQDLLALGDPTLRPYVGDVAFGSLLHMVEDSFAAGHVDRLPPADNSHCKDSAYFAPGPILELHSYTHQNSSSHARADTRDAFVNNRLPPDVVEVGRVLVSMRKSNETWDTARRYLMCAYDFAPGVRQASAGNF